MKNINNRIMDASQIFNMALADKTILKTLSSAGYNKERLSSMREIVEQVCNLKAVRAKEYAEQLSATSEQEKQVSIADKSYMRVLKLARVALGDNILAKKELELFARRKIPIDNWVAQADLFYQGLLSQPDYLKTLSEFGLSSKDIEQGYQSLKEISSARVIQKQETAQAILATANRDAELEKMDKVYSDFKKVCRVIFEDDKESLNKLGL